MKLILLRSSLLRSFAVGKSDRVSNSLSGELRLRIFQGVVEEDEKASRTPSLITRCGLPLGTALAVIAGVAVTVAAVAAVGGVDWGLWVIIAVVS